MTYLYIFIILKSYHHQLCLFFLLGQFFRANVQCPNEMLKLYPFDEYSCNFTMSQAKTLHALSNTNRVKYNMAVELQKPLLTGIF